MNKIDEFGFDATAFFGQLDEMPSQTMDMEDSSPMDVLEGMDLEKIDEDDFHSCGFKGG